MSGIEKRIDKQDRDKDSQEHGKLVDISEIDWDEVADAYAAKAVDELSAARPDLAERIKGSDPWERLIELSALEGVEKAAGSGQWKAVDEGQEPDFIKEGFSGLLLEEGQAELAKKILEQRQRSSRSVNAVDGAASFLAGIGTLALSIAFNYAWIAVGVEWASAPYMVAGFACAFGAAGLFSKSLDAWRGAKCV